MHRFLSFHFNSIQFNSSLPFDSVHSLLSPVSIQFNSFITSFQFNNSLIASFPLRKRSMNYWIEMKRWMNWIESKRGKAMNELNWKEVMNWIERKRCIRCFLSTQLISSLPFNSIRWSSFFLPRMFAKVAKLNKFTNISFKFTNISFKFSNISFEILENLKKNQFFKYLGTICDYSYFSAN